jgi:hypothetical protein
MGQENDEIAAQTPQACEHNWEVEKEVYDGIGQMGFSWGAGTMRCKKCGASYDYGPGIPEPPQIGCI